MKFTKSIPRKSISILTMFIVLSEYYNSIIPNDYNLYIFETLKEARKHKETVEIIDNLKYIIIEYN